MVTFGLKGDSFLADRWKKHRTPFSRFKGLGVVQTVYREVGGRGQAHTGTPLSYGWCHFKLALRLFGTPGTKC